MSKFDGFRAMVSSSKGFSLLPTLTVCTCIGLLCGLYGTVAELYANMVTLHASSEQSYWLARSEGITILRELENHESPSPPDTVPSSLGTVSVLTSEDAQKQWMIQVTARVPGAIDTVVFRYDESKQLCTLWLDNVVPVRNLT